MRPRLRTNTLQSGLQTRWLCTMDQSRSQQITIKQTTWVISSGVYQHCSGRGNKTDTRSFGSSDLHFCAVLYLCLLLTLRHNITAPPLRGCVDHLTEDTETIEYNKTIGVTAGCPVSLLVRKRDDQNTRLCQVSCIWLNTALKYLLYQPYLITVGKKEKKKGFTWHYVTWITWLTR